MAQLRWLEIPPIQFPLIEDKDLIMALQTHIIS
jgi:hypothetical protein